jgi:hypothetical protein
VQGTGFEAEGEIMTGIDADGTAKTEADHFMKCPGYCQWFDKRDLSQVAEHAHDGSEIEVSEVAGGEGESNLVNKITWAQVGRVTDLGRYMVKFGWLTITADDLAIWQAYPNAAFTLLRTLTPTTETEAETIDEYRLGTFELRENISLSEK